MKWLATQSATINIPIARAVALLGFSRSGYYAAKRRGKSKRAMANEALTPQVKAIFQQHKGRYGSPRIHKQLETQGHKLGRNRVISAMKTNGLSARKPRRFVRTTDSSACNTPAPNLLQQDFSAPAANRKWVADVTYLTIPGGFIYLAVMLDLYSRKVVGWSVSANNDAELTTDAMRKAMQSRNPPQHLVVHSDRGSTYTAKAYVDMLKAAALTQSMSAKGNCYDNAAMESFFATLKRELGEDFDSRGEAQLQLFEYIEEYYNRERMHSALGYKSPWHFENAMQKAA